MLVVISPAKKLDWSERAQPMTTPDFLPDANRLARRARNLTLRDLGALMGLSDDLARLNRDRFRAYSDDPDPQETRPAALAFAGDTYQGLEAGTLEPRALDWAQAHLRILSGLYGLLRPLDAIQPYRLEMGSRLRTRRGDTLYAYWRGDLARALRAQADAVGTGVVLNCASKEYFGAVPADALRLRVITPQFLEEGEGGARMVSFHAKRARGAMARYVMEHELTDPGELAGFEAGGYRLSPDLSTPDAPVFTRAMAA